MNHLVNARSAAPIRKLTIGGAVAFIVWLAFVILEGAESGLSIPSWLSSAATYVTFFGTAYMVKSQGSDPTG